MQTSKVLTDGYNAILSYLADTRQSEDSVRRHQAAYRKLEAFFKKEGRAVYDPATNRDFRKDIIMKADAGEISHKQYRLLMRVSSMMDDHYQGQQIQVRYSYGNRYRCGIPPAYEEILDSFSDWLPVAKNTIPGFRSPVRQFLCYLHGQGIDDLHSIDLRIVADFLVSVSGSRRASMNNVLSAIRKFLSFLVELSMCSCSPDMPMAFRSAPARRKVYPSFSTDELRKLLSAPDRTTAMGIRDYAVLLLASCTGIRAIDIANLRVDDIDHGAMSLSFVQHKTSRGQSLPVDAAVLSAIDAYMAVRPDTDSPYLFQTLSAPYRKLSDISSVRNILVKYLKASGIQKSPWDGKGFHAFRRGMGVWLLESGHSPELIAQVLGHKNDRMLKHYLPLSPASLKKCALGFGPAPLGSEVYR